MTSPEDQVNRPPEELLWINLEREEPVMKKIQSKGISGILVPVGCVTTAGVLLSGLHQMFKKNKEKQQILMRYRVLAQGVTLCIAMMGILKVKFS